jgi:hypothetical protein
VISLEFQEIIYTRTTFIQENASEEENINSTNRNGNAMLWSLQSNMRIKNNSMIQEKSFDETQFYNTENWDEL